MTGGVDYGPVRRPFPIEKALDDALLAWGMNGEPLLPDHGYPLRLVLPGWVGIASIKWLGSLEVSTTELTSPWNTKWYRHTGDATRRLPAADVNPVRSAWELPWGAELDRRPPDRADRPLVERRRPDPPGRGERRRRHDLGAGAPRARPASSGWTQWSWSWRRPEAGAHELLARATDAAGRTQPLVDAVQRQRLLLRRGRPAPGDGGLNRCAAPRRSRDQQQERT